MVTKNHTFGQLVELLCAIGQVAPGSKSTFISRIMQLQRLGFPDGVNVGHGRRMKYSLAEIYKLAISFEILATGIPPRIALNALRLNWELIAECISSFYDENSKLHYQNFHETIILMTPNHSDFSVCSGLLLQTANLSDLVSVILNSHDYSDRGCLMVIRLYPVIRNIDEYLAAANPVTDFQIS